MPAGDARSDPLTQDPPKIRRVASPPVRGSLRERRPGVWELIVQLPRDPVTGKPRQTTRTISGTKRDAQRALSALVAEVDAGNVSASTATLDELLDKWLEVKAERLSITTAAEYRRLAKTVVSPALGTTLIRRLSTEQLDRFYGALARDRKLSPSSIHQVHAVVRGSLGQAVKWGWLKVNPAVSASPPAIRRKEIVPPGVDQAVLLLARAEERDFEFGALLRLMAATGARRGEICGLRWSDIDFGARSLLIRRSVAVIGSELLEKDTKTHAARRIAIDDHTLDVLRRHRSAVDKRAEELGTEVAAEGFVFSPAADGLAPTNPDRLTDRFRKLCVRLKITGVRLHDLRHLHATQLLAAGVPVPTVSGRLGHANAATTLNVYAHFVEASDRQAADVISDLLQGPAA